MNSFCATEHISPLSLNKIQRLEVVPASKDIMYFAISDSPSQQLPKDCIPGRPDAFFQFHSEFPAYLFDFVIKSHFLTDAGLPAVIQLTGTCVSTSVIRLPLGKYAMFFRIRTDRITFCTVSGSIRCFDFFGEIGSRRFCQCFSKATPHNSARKLSERFSAGSKFRKRGNTVCISRFWSYGTGAKDPRRSADAIVRCCLKVFY